MHDALRRRIMRRLDTLPEAQLYQVLDYIEFLESRYARGEVTDATGLQRFAERLEDGLRRRTVNPSNLREAFQLISAADRVLSTVSEAGRQLLEEMQDSSERRGEPRAGSQRAGSPPTGSPPGGSPPGETPRDGEGERRAGGSGERGERRSGERGEAGPGDRRAGGSPERPGSGPGPGEG